MVNLVGQGGLQIWSDGWRLANKSRHTGRWTLEDRFASPWHYLPGGGAGQGRPGSRKSGSTTSAPTGRCSTSAVLARAGSAAGRAAPAGRSSSLTRRPRPDTCPGRSRPGRGR